MILFNKHNYYIIQNQFWLNSKNAVSVLCELCSTEMWFVVNWEAI